MNVTVPVDQAPNRNDRRRMETRARLIAAGRQVIGEKGIDAATIQDITDTADVGRGSFYNFFETKEDLVAAVIGECVDEMMRFEHSVADAFDDPAHALSALCRYGIEIAAGDPLLAAFLDRTQNINSPFYVAFHGVATKVLEDGRRTGRFHLDDVELAYVMVAGITRAAMEAFRLDVIPMTSAAAVVAGVLRLLGLEPKEAEAIAATPLASRHDLVLG